MPPRFLVRGGGPLRGSIRPAGNKNAALPILAGTVLADGPMELDNIPRIRDVETMLALLVDLGASAEWTGPQSRAGGRAGGAAQAARPQALRAHPRVDPARRAAARAVRQSDAAAARRRRHRAPPGGHPLPGARAARRVGHRRGPLRARGQEGADRRATSFSTSQASRAPRTRSWRPSPPRAGPCSGTPRASRTSRTSPARWWRWVPRSTASAPTSTRSRAGARWRGAAYAIGPDHIEIGSFIGLAAVTNGDDHHRPGAGRRPPKHAARDSSGSASGRASRATRLTVDGRPGAPHPARPRRARAEARGRAVAGLSRRRDVDHDRHAPPSAPACCWCSRRCSSRGCSSSTS